MNRTLYKKIKSVYKGIKKIFNFFGFEITLKSSPVRSFAGFFDLIKSKGFQPGTVFDVGVGNGTNEIYESFPRVQHVLVEPLEEFEEVIEGLKKKYNALYFKAAAGKEEGSISIACGNASQKSSIVKKIIRDSNQVETREVPLTTIDNICSENNFKTPFIIKVDVEGAELLVMEGARKALEDTEIVILEIAIWDRFGEVPELHEVVTKMKKYGFVVFDIVGLADMYRNRGILGYSDIVFVNEKGFFRDGKILSSCES
ncbi:MAG: FkbM family methyltransferase [Nitrospinota bacterium]